MLIICRLKSLDVLRLPALRAFRHLELNGLTLLQTAKAACLNGGEVYEYILAVLAADKTIPFRVVKPLYCSLFQLMFLFLYLIFG